MLPSLFRFLRIRYILNFNLKKKILRNFETLSKAKPPFHFRFRFSFHAYIPCLIVLSVFCSVQPTRNVVRVSNHGTANSDLDSDEENEDGEYTVYECPGLAPTGEMEVKNPLFQDDLTPMSSPSVLNGKPQNK